MARPVFSGRGDLPYHPVAKWGRCFAPRQTMLRDPAIVGALEPSQTTLDIVNDLKSVCVSFLNKFTIYK